MCTTVYVRRWEEGLLSADVLSHIYWNQLGHPSSHSHEISMIILLEDSQRLPTAAGSTSSSTMWKLYAHKDTNILSSRAVTSLEAPEHWRKSSLWYTSWTCILGWLVPMESKPRVLALQTSTRGLPSMGTSTLVPMGTGSSRPSVVHHLPGELAPAGRTTAPINAVSVWTSLTLCATHDTGAVYLTGIVNVNSGIVYFHEIILGELVKH